MGIDLNLLDNHIYNSNTWMNEDMVCPILFQALEISLGISFTTPCKVAVVFKLMKAIAFHALRPLNSAWECHMFLLLTILTLRNSEVYICSADGSNMASNIEVSIN